MLREALHQSTTLTSEACGRNNTWIQKPSKDCPALKLSDASGIDTDVHTPAANGPTMVPGWPELETVACTWKEDWTEGLITKLPSAFRIAKQEGRTTYLRAT